MTLLPSVDDTTEMAQVQLAARSAPGDLEDEVDALTEVEDGEKKEVDLGQFGVTAFQPLSNTTLRIDLHLVLEDDEAEFEQLFKAHENRLR